MLSWLPHILYTPVSPLGNKLKLASFMLTSQTWVWYTDLLVWHSCLALLSLLPWPHLIIWRLVHFCHRIQEQCHCTINHSTESDRFMLSQCPWTSVTSRSFCLALPFDPWPILKLQDSHCKGSMWIFYNLHQSTSSSKKCLFFKLTVSDLHPIWRPHSPTPLHLDSLHKGNVAICFLIFWISGYNFTKSQNTLNEN